MKRVLFALAIAVGTLLTFESCTAEENNDENLYQFEKSSNAGDKDEEPDRNG